MPWPLAQELFVVPRLLPCWIPPREVQRPAAVLHKRMHQAEQMWIGKWFAWQIIRRTLANVRGDRHIGIIVSTFFNPQPTPEGGLHAPATQRNREPILEVLRQVLPAEGMVLEISSGTGQHAAFFAAGLPGVSWQPSDLSAEHLRSIEAWRQVSAASNLLAPMFLDVQASPWPVTRAAAVVNINMIHIAPWEACKALMSGAAELLQPGAPLILYGPFKRNGEHTSESNAAFDARLRQEDPRWGVRDLNDVEQLALQANFALEQVVTMPANNLSVVFRRRPD